jgi:tagatose-6-phosphate ketose/aldose isomerase
MLSTGTSLPSPLATWLERLRSSPGLGPLLERSAAEQRARGYLDTVREIAQQPLTWPATAKLVGAQPIDLGGDPIFVTGSGSSYYIAECLAPTLQEALGVATRAVPSGDLLTHPGGILPAPGAPATLISLARSGDSPESWAAAERVLRDRPRARHVVITCNPRGALAVRSASDPRARVIVLDETTCDRSLVMTSSFTNLFVAGLALAGRDGATALAAAAAAILTNAAGELAELAGQDLRSVVYLGSGPAFGAAHEGALKMIEMTAGTVACLAETYLGLRHGPMSALRRDTLVVAFVSSDPVRRRYELDLLADLERKVGPRRLVVGAGLPTQIAGPRDVVVDVGPAGGFGDAELPALDVVAAQLLALFRCLALGGRPDAPSAGGVIHRVVERFSIYEEERP